MGIVVNHPAPNINFSDLLVKLDVIPAADVIQLPSRAGVVKVMRGGPVETERGFVLHTRRFFHREFDAADRRRHLPHRDARHSQGDRARRRPRQRDPGARLCRLGAGPARKRNPGQRLAALRAGFRSDLRHRYRRQIRQGAEEDRHRSRHAVERSRTRLASRQRRIARVMLGPLTAVRCASDLARAAAASSRARSGVIGSPNTKPCAYSQPS